MPRRTHRSTCPACGAEPDRIVVLPQEIISCPGCGLQTSAHEWQTHADGSDTGCPRSSVIREESSNGDLRWIIPAAGNAGVSMTFWSLWCVASIALAVFLATKAFPEYGVASLLFLLSFPIPVLVIGLVFLYLAVVGHHAQHGIALTKDMLEIRRDVLGWQKRLAFPRSRIRHISRIPTRKNADREHETIEIRAGKQRVRFGEHLSPEEREEFVNEMRLQVFGPPVPAPDGPRHSARLPEHFSFLITHRMLHNLPFAFVSIIFGSIFLAVILRYMKPEAVTPGGEEFFILRAMEWGMSMVGNVMRIVLIVVSSAWIAGGLWLLIHSLHQHLRQTAVEVAPALVTVRKLSRSGRTLGSKEYPRKESSEIRTSLQSITGGVTLKRLELLDGANSTTIVSDIRAEDAEEILRSLPG